MPFSITGDFLTFPANTLSLSQMTVNYSMAGIGFSSLPFP